MGNILILKHRAEERGIKVNIMNVSLNDEFITSFDSILLSISV